MHIVEEFQNSSIPHQHTDDYVSTTTVRIMSFIVILIVIPLLILCGSIGNIISLVVLFHQRMRNQTNYLLAALCISDTLFLLHSFVFTCLHVYKMNNRIEGEELRAHVYPIVGAYGSVVTARITSGLTTLLCIERFVAVFFPIQARNICTIRNTVLAIILIYTTTLIVFIPYMLKYEAIVIVYNGNATRTIMNTTEFYNHNTGFYNVYGTCLNIIFRFAPIIVIPILNVLMIRAVKSTWKQRRKMSQTESQCSLRLSSRNGKHCSSNEQNRITIMLLAVTFVFFICILPGALNSIATHIWPVYAPLGKARNLYLCISAFTFLLETLNSSVNFLIYMFLSRKFRLQYKETFCCGKGEYYRKISISSVREKFRWSSTRKPGQTYENGIFGRKTVSDIGPFRNDNTTNQYDKENWEYAALVKGCDFKIGAESSSSDNKQNSHNASNSKSVRSPKGKRRGRLHSANDIDQLNGYRTATLERSVSYKPDLEELNVALFNSKDVSTSDRKTFHNNNGDLVMADRHEKRKKYPVKFKFAQILHLKPVT